MLWKLLNDKALRADQIKKDKLMAEIIRVNMTDLEVKIAPVPEKYAILGGRGLISQVLLDEVDPTCEPLGRYNKLIVCPGVLGGTRVSTSGRLSIGGKSPLTGGIKESNSGGVVGRMMAKLGIKAIILEGKLEFESCNILKVSAQEVTLIPSAEYAGMGNYELTEKLREKYGPKIGIISIGPAGEKQMGAASIAVTDMDGMPNRFCGRGGLGAVMGSKGIKAIVFDDKDAAGHLFEMADEEGFNAIAKDWNKSLPAAKKALTDFGTAVLVKPVSAQNAFPTRNFSEGTFEGADKICGQALAELIKSRGGKTGHPCQPGCVIRCSNVFHDEQGNHVVSALEYETIGLFGSNLGIDSLDVIATLNRKCNDLGLDTMDIGAALGVAMESGLANFGDSKAALEMVDNIGKGTILGKVLGQGAAITGKVLGVRRVPAVKGQSFASYDPRGLKGTGVTYATSAMGADHTAGNLLPGREGQDPNLADGQIEASRHIQIYATVLDAMGFCNFLGPSLPEMGIIAQLLSKAAGREVPVDEVLQLGKETIKREKEFNYLAGFTKANDRLPEFVKTEKIGPKKLSFDIADKDLETVLDF